MPRFMRGFFRAMLFFKIIVYEIAYFTVIHLPFVSGLVLIIMSFTLCEIIIIVLLIALRIFSYVVLFNFFKILQLLYLMQLQIETA